MPSVTFLCPHFSLQGAVMARDVRLREPHLQHITQLTCHWPRREYEDGEDVSDEADAADGQGEHAVAPVPRAAPRRHVLHHVLQERSGEEKVVVVLQFGGYPLIMQAQLLNFGAPHVQQSPHSSYCSLKEVMEHAHKKSLALGWCILHS